MMSAGSPLLPGLAVLDQSIRRRRPSRVIQWFSCWLVERPFFSSRNDRHALSSSSGTINKSQKVLPTTSCRDHPVAFSLARLKRRMRPSASSTTTSDAIASRIAEVESRSSASAWSVAECARVVSRKRARSSIAMTSACANAPGAFAITFSTPVTTRVDVTQWTDRKRKAMQAHASQISETSFFLSIPEEFFARAFGQEWYIRRGPRPEKRETSLFNGLD